MEVLSGVVSLISILILYFCFLILIFFVQVVIFACMVAASQAQYRSSPFKSSPFKSQPYRPSPAVSVGFAPVQARGSYSGDARNANILKQDSDVGPDGSYNY